MKKLFFMLLLLIMSIAMVVNSSLAAEEEMTTLRIVTPYPIERPMDIIKVIDQKFMEENPDIKIEYIATQAADCPKRVIAMATSGDMPDIFFLSPELIKGTYYEMGICADMGKLFGEDYIKGYNPKLIDEASVNDFIVGLPFSIQPYGLLYRSDWFEEEGLKPPTTWDEFLIAAQKLTKDTDGDGKIDRWGHAMMGSASMAAAIRFNVILRTFGVKGLYRDANGNIETDLDSPASKDAFKFYTDLFLVNGVVPPGPTEVAYGEAITLMATERTAMVISGTHSVGGIISQNPELAGKIAGTLVPKKEKHVSMLNTDGFAIAESSKNKDAAVKYLKWLFDASNSEEFFKLTGKLPTRIESEKIIDQKVYSGFLKAAEYAESFPVKEIANDVTYYYDFCDAVTLILQSILTGTDVDTATERGVEVVRNLIKENE